MQCTEDKVLFRGLQCGDLLDDTSPRRGDRACVRAAARIVPVLSRQTTRMVVRIEERVEVTAESRDGEHELEDAALIEVKRELAGVPHQRTKDVHREPRQPSSERQRVEAVALQAAAQNAGKSCADQGAVCLQRRCVGGVVDDEVESVDEARCLRVAA